MIDMNDYQTDGWIVKFRDGRWAFAFGPDAELARKAYLRNWAANIQEVTPAGDCHDTPPPHLQVWLSGADWSIAVDTREPSDAQRQDDNPLIFPDGVQRVVDRLADLSTIQKEQLESQRMELEYLRTSLEMTKDVIACIRFAEGTLIPIGLTPDAQKAAREYLRKEKTQ